LNLWLLIGILRLQHGPKISPWQLWLENRWASSIDVIVMSVGGGLLAFAVARYDSLGILIFFLPIFLSAYAFRLYVRQMQAHMDHLEEIVAQRTSQLAKLHQDKDAFLAVLAHDMKQPLTSVIAYAELLRSYPNLPDVKRTQMADTIIRGGVTLRDIVENILEIEAIRPGESPALEKNTVELKSVISEVLLALEVQARDKEIHLGQSVEEANLCIQADGHKVQRILMNLVSNAIKYTPENGTILVSAAKKGHWAVITVQDTGYGIPKEELPHIFDRYHRVDKHKDKANGTGLGLAIVKSLVAAHGGEVRVSSEEGVGSTFTVKLPL
jgi:signal transduction histidine kinase